MASIQELKDAVKHWESVEKNGGSPTSAVKLAGAKAALAEAKAAVKPARRAKKVEPVEEIIEEEIIEEAADEEE